MSTDTSPTPAPDTHVGDRDGVRIAELFAALASPACSPAEKRRARDAIVTTYLPLASRVARRFRDRGEPLADLVQVATVGLLKAVDGYDPDRGVDFPTYAIPTMTGEVKRYFRDKGWMVRVPRRLQELRIEISRATAALTQALGRIPTTADLAHYLGVSEAEIRECTVSSQAYSAASLSAAGGDSVGASLQTFLGGPDPELAAVEDRQSLSPLVRALPDRERSIVAMRFYRHMTQSQIAAELGISQMHVSRLLNRTLSQLRRALDGGGGGPAEFRPNGAVLAAASRSGQVRPRTAKQ